MPTYTKKRILVIFTGGTVTGNVARSNVLQNIKSDPDSFIFVLNNAVDIIKKNWNIEIDYSTEELFSGTIDITP